MRPSGLARLSDAPTTAQKRRRSPLRKAGATGARADNARDHGELAGVPDCVLDDSLEHCFVGVACGREPVSANSRWENCEFSLRGVRFSGISKSFPQALKRIYARN